MAEKVIMPKQGLQMTEGTIIQWLVQEGGPCVQGEPLFEMETDKLTITMDAPASGTLLKIVRDEGETVPITELIAVIGQPGEDISSLFVETGVSATQKIPETQPELLKTPEAPAVKAEPIIDGKRNFSTPRARMRAEEKGVDIAGIPPSGPDNLVIERDVLFFEGKPQIKATPLAKKAAERNGVELGSVEGTGSHGKITKADILTVVEARAVAKTGAQRGERIIPMRGMRKVIAERMQESLRVHAQLTHTVRTDMTNAAALREAYKRTDKKISYNDIVLKAVSQALLDFPVMNATITNEGIVMRDYVNLGVAVAVENGLIVPNIKSTDLMRLEEISFMAKELADKAKNGSLSLEEMSGGTFTVSNLGMFGLDEFTAIINTPESGILALGAITKTPVVVSNEIAIRPIMSMTLTYDHRIVDGAPAAQFLGRIKQYVEEPALML